MMLKKIKFLVTFIFTDNRKPVFVDIFVDIINIDNSFVRTVNKLLAFVVAFVVIVIIVLLNSGCDVCNTGDGKADNDIIFTAFSLDGDDVPGIYVANQDGDNLSQLIRNGILFSAPSISQKLVFRRPVIGTVRQEIVTAGLDGSNQVAIFPADPIGDVFPVMSPKGNYFAYGTKENQLIISDITGLKQNEVTLNLASSTLPSFSPDGSMIAFFEGKVNLGPVKVKVIESDASNEIKVVLELTYDNGIDYRVGEPSISWSNNNTIAYLISNDSTDIIYFHDLISGQVHSREFDRSIGFKGVYMPVLSPDGERLAFSGRDGSIWIVEVYGDNPEYTKVKSSVESEVNAFMQWSPDGQKLIYSQYYGNEEKASLFLYDIVNSVEIIIGNNVDRGFWIPK